MPHLTRCVRSTYKMASGKLIYNGVMFYYRHIISLQLFPQSLRPTWNVLNHAAGEKPILGRNIPSGSQPEKKRDRLKPAHSLA